MPSFIRRALRVLAAVACVAAVAPLVPAQAASRDTVHRLPSSDWRHAWVGQWAVEFTFDSVRTSTPAGMRWRAATGNRVSGVLAITDSATGRDGFEVLATLTMDFRALIGHEMACREEGRVPIRLTKQATMVVVEFTPHVADCGFSATVSRSGDGAKGQWSETTFAGPVRLGRLVLRRR